MSDITIPNQQHPAEPAPESGRHTVNVGHLVMGVAFLGLTVVWALIASDTVEGSDIRWLMPIPWVAAGLAGVLASILPSGRRRFEQRQTGWITPEPTETPEETAPETTPETTDTPEENR